MNWIKRVRHYWLTEPCTWIFICLFQPSKFNRNFEQVANEFRRDFEKASFWKYLIQILKLFLPSLLFLYLLTMCLMIVSSVTYFIEYYISKWANHGLLGFLSYMYVNTLNIIFYLYNNSITNFLEAFLVAGLISLPIIFIYALTSKKGELNYNCLSALFGCCILTIIVYSININESIGDITYPVLIGILFDIVVGTLNSKPRHLGIYGMIACIMISIAIGISIGNIKGFIIGSTTIIGCLLGYYRVPFYLLSGPSGLRAYFASRNTPSQVFTYLHRSALHWDERIHLPLPYLEQTLLIATKHDAKQALEEIAFIASARPMQIRAVRLIYPEIILGDLAMRRTLPEIAEASQHLTAIISQKAKLINQYSMQSFTRLHETTQEAARYYSPISRRTRLNVLEDMKANLREIQLKKAFREEELNNLLARVVETWVEVAQHEQEKLESVPEEIGHIENPYNPGKVLKPGDPLFVGRDDIVQQLEEALSRRGSRPTFLLNGERRIGKTSVIRQFSNMLGTRYFPVYYDLQQRGISSSAARFFETIVAEVRDALGTRNIKVDELEYKHLYKASKENEAAVYYVFNKWLKRLEYILEHEDRTLLLSFDEFEKLAEAGQAKYLDLRLLLDWFRSVIQNYSRLALLFSGVHTLGEMSSATGINWASYFVNVQTLRVSFLQPDEARQLITQPVSGKEIFSEEVVNKIIDETGCHPFLVQAVCSALVNNLNAEKQDHAAVQDVKEAVDQVFKSWWDGYFRDLWERTDEHQRTCLDALRMLGRADLRHIEQDTGLDERMVRRTLQTLLRRDLVLQDENATYRIASPIFSEWVERAHYS